MAETRPRGRPRSEEARAAVLSAALELCRAHGYHEVTIKGIADAAGVGRQTVYRWWPAKADVVLDALLDLTDREVAALRLDGPDTMADVRTLLDLTFAYNRDVTGPALIGLMADAQLDPGLSERLQARLLGPRRRALRDLLARGVERGELAAAVSLDLAVDFAFGTMWYRLLSRHGAIDSALAAEITQALRRILAPG